MSLQSGPDMSPCDRCRSRLDEWRRDCLPSEEMREMEAHLAVCEGCAAELAAQEQLGSLIRGTSEKPELPPHYMDDVMGRVRDRLNGGKVVSARHRLTAPWWAVAAASVITVAGLAWMATRADSQQYTTVERQIAYHDQEKAHMASPVPARKPQQPLAAEAADSAADLAAPVPASRALQAPAGSVESAPAGRERRHYRTEREKLFERHTESTQVPATSRIEEPGAFTRLGKAATLSFKQGAPSNDAAADSSFSPASPSGVPMQMGAISDNDRQSTVSFQRGEEARLAGRYHEALTYYESAIRTAPGSPEAAWSQMRIGEMAFDHLQDRERARQAFRTCLEPPLSRHFDAATLESLRQRLEQLKREADGTDEMDRVDGIE